MPDQQPSGDKTAIVVVTYQSADVLPGLLETLAAGCAGVGTRLIVVDNASTDRTKEIISAAPAAHLVALANNAGYAAGLNAGYAALADDISVGSVLVLNPDIRLRPAALVHLREALSEPSVGIAVPCLLGPTGVVACGLRRTPTIRRALGEAFLGGHRAGRHPALGEVVTDPEVYRVSATADWATGAAMLISRDCWDAIGGWDESFFLYSEETDFALRARDAGYMLRYVPEAGADHLGGDATTNPRLHALLTRNRVRLHRKRWGSARAAGFWAAVVIGEALRAPRSALHRNGLRALLPGGHALAASPEPPPSLNTQPGRRSPDPVPLSVVMPAHNEERVIAENLSTLLADAEEGEFDVVVVCNGSTDATAEEARRIPGARIVNLAVPGKHAAMVHGDTLARGFPRIYVDADVRLDTQSARLLGRAVTDAGVLAAGPQRRLLLHRSPWPVRAYYAVWRRLPQVVDGLFGRGVIAVSQAGYERVRGLPLARSDDLAVHLAFGPGERRIVSEATAIIRPPRTTVDLFRRRVRAMQGTSELRDAESVAASRGATTWTDLAVVVREHPSTLAAMPIFLGFAIGAKAAVRWGRFEPDRWFRDESSRT